MTQRSAVLLRVEPDRIDGYVDAAPFLKNRQAQLWQPPPFSRRPCPATTLTP